MYIDPGPLRLLFTYWTAAKNEPSLDDVIDVHAA